MARPTADPTFIETAISWIVEGFHRSSVELVDCMSKLATFVTSTTLFFVLRMEHAPDLSEAVE
jgi:hypothetical protein